LKDFKMPEKNVLAIIQARMGSTRLPGKVLLPLAGRPVLWHVVSRVQACSLVNQVVVATTTSAKDHVLLQEIEKCGAKAFRGSEDDVLSRYFHAAKKFAGEIIVRITSDCPLFEPDILEKMLRIFFDLEKSGEEIDYFSNIRKRTFPRGLDTEIFTYDALEKAHLKAVKRYDREHVTPYIYQHPNDFRIRDHCGEKDHSHHRWTLDTPEDYKLIEIIFSNLYKPNRIFHFEEILEFIEKNPELSNINAHIEQKKD